MIEAIKEIGKLSLARANKDSLKQLVENPNNGKYPNVVIINIRVEEEKGTSHLIELEETSEDYFRYLFRNGSSRGNNFSPTARVTALDNTYSQKILGWFKVVEKEKDLEIPEYLGSISTYLLEEKEKILDEIEKIASELKEDYFVSLKINDNYLLSIEEFKQIFIHLVNKKEMQLFSNNKVCSICGEEKDTVIGKMSVFAFYTLDKQGFITGGLNEDDAWRNYPVCLECKSYIEEGRKVLENLLRFNFYGMSYFLIPKFMINDGTINDNQDEVVDILFNMKKRIQLKKDHSNRITSDENEILDLLAESKDTLTLTLLFLQKSNSAERILLTIDDVLPSRLRSIFKAKDRVDKLFYENKDQSFHFGCIRTFFSKSSEGKKDNDLNKYFLEIINSIFKGNKLDFKFIVKFIMQETRPDFSKLDSESSFYWKLRDAYAMIIFFENLGILDKKGGCDLSDFNAIYDKYGQQLDTEEKKGIFLLGALTQMLINTQYSERNSKPFLKQLKGLKMDEKTIRGLLSKVVNKFQEYDRYDKGKQRMAEEISRYFLSSQQKWKLTIDELNFYFVAGMSLSEDTKEVIYKKESVENGN